MPIVYNLDKTMKSRIDEFYGNASVYRSNKFLVGFYGEYVGKAVAKMEKESKIDSLTKNQKMHGGRQIYYEHLGRWKELFYYKDTDPPQVEMKWACTDVTIPHTTSKIETKNYIDSIKSIKYPIITGQADTGKIVINVRDDKDLMWYQFFNAIINQFYSAQILKPKSSFQKLGMYIAILQEQYVNTPSTMESGKIRQYGIDTVPTQVFEFNSIVLTDMSAMTLKNDSKDIMEYKVTFDAPNTFQGSFNDAFRGLRDNTSVGIDKKMMSGGKYNPAEFTVSTGDLKSNGNGWYPD